MQLLTVFPLLLEAVHHDMVRQKARKAPGPDYQALKFEAP